VLLAGGSGFIGRHLAQKLIAENITPVVVDWVEPKIEGCEYRSADIRTLADLLPGLLEAVEAVYLLAWTTKPQSANDDPGYDLSSNVLAGVHLLDGMLKLTKRPRLIFVSTGGAVYGAVEQQPITEAVTPLPIGAYGLSKWTFEQYLMLYHRIHDLEYLIYRPGNPYGEYQDSTAGQGAVAVFLGKIARNETIQVWGDGNVVRDYLHISDLVEALYLGLEYRVKDQQRIFNVGSGKGESLAELIELLRAVCAKEIAVEYLPGRKVDVPKVILDYSKAQKYLGWSPKIFMRQGLAQTWAWVQTCE